MSPAKVRPQTPRGSGYVLVERILKPIIKAMAKRQWRGGENLRRPGGLVVAANHLSWFDPLVVAHFVNDNGRPVRFLAKAEIFKVPVIGKLIASAGQIPVSRGTSAAVSSLHAAVDAVKAGECVVIYPEGTLTRDKNLWPMTAKSGAARIALSTGAPVVPVAHWGAQDVLPPYGKSVHVIPRRTVHVLAGPPVNLDDLRGQPITASLLAEATSRIMAAITGLLAELRGEQPPTAPLDRDRALGDAALSDAALGDAAADNTDGGAH